MADGSRVVFTGPGSAEMESFAIRSPERSQVLARTLSSDIGPGTTLPVMLRAAGRNARLLVVGHAGVPKLITHRAPAHGAAKAYTMAGEARPGWQGIVIDWEAA